MSEEILLSASDCRKGLQCPKILWMRKNCPNQEEPSLLQEPYRTQAEEVRGLALKLFDGYTEVPSGTPEEMAEATEQLLSSGAEILVNAVFLFQGCYCTADVVTRNRKQGINVGLIRCSSSVREIYFQDAAYQYAVISGCGYKIKEMSVIHLNTRYVRSGQLDVSRLFVSEPVFKTARKRAMGMAERIEEIRCTLESDSEPDQPVGAYCFSPFRCVYFESCADDLPKPNVFDLGRTQLDKKLEWYNRGLRSFEDLLLFADLNPAQRMQIECTLDPEKEIIDRERIRTFLERFYYPLYFLDFESFQPAVPVYDHTSPFQQIVFQYSLHFIEQPEGKIGHKEFLARPYSDPRRETAEHLCRDIPEHACIVVYNESFEKRRIREMAEWFSDLREQLMHIHGRIIDLIVPFEKRMYYTAGMNGSHSIKHVLPALYSEDPELNYDMLEGVHDGAEASALFAAMGRMEEAELEKNRRHLLAYCGLDTLAMVKLYKKLKEAAQ